MTYTVPTIPPAALRTQCATQATHMAHFAVIGGGLGGLAAAIALTRVGHAVTVFEQDAEDAKLCYGGIRIPPNQSKIIAAWGLTEEFEKISIGSRILDFYHYDSGEYMGKHLWDEAIMKECDGDWMFTRHCDFRNLLIQVARANGADLRFGTRVVEIDEDDAVILLEDGEVFKADVVIGSDGPQGITRQVVKDNMDHVQESGKVVYNTIIPIEKIKEAAKEDSSLLDVLRDDATCVWGSGDHAALSFPTGPSNELALNIYVPQDKGVPGSDWHAPPVSVEEMLSTMTNAEPRLIKLAKMAGPTPAIAIRQYVPVDEDDWVLPSELGAILGDGAHPAPVGSIQGCAMAMEDAAVLGKLFSHLRRADQIPRLLNAYATLRAERSAAVTAGEEGNYRYMTLPEPDASGRDAIYRELKSKGMNVFGGLGGDDEDIASSLWIAIFTVWIYDAEDEADNWWIQWGALGERDHGGVRTSVFDFGAAISGVSTTATSTEVY